MKKLLLMIGVLAMSAGTIHGQSKINAQGRLMISDFRALQLEAAQSPFHTMSTPVEPRVAAVVILNDGVDASVLETIDGVTVESELNGVAVVSCPITAAETIAELPQVQQVGFGQEMKANLDFARPASHVSEVQAGFASPTTGATVSFDGTGVVCGMMDTGLEANHLNFKNTDGTSRIKRLFHMTGSNGTCTTYTDANVGTFTTDATTATHATHVAGILGGGYKGNGTYAYLTTASNSTGGKRENSPIPYYGVATNSNLAFAVGSLYDANIVSGVTNIINYANTVGQPAVVNLSLGMNTGPHDGSDYVASALKRLGQDAIICVSAGNEGDEQIAVKKTLGATGTNAYLRTCCYGLNSSGAMVQTAGSGQVDVWSSDSKPLTATWKVLYGATLNSTATIMSLSEAGTVNTTGNTTFSNYFTGSIKMTAGLSSNGRYEVYSEVSFTQVNTSAVLMLEITGTSGTTVYVYGNGINFNNTNSAGSTPAFLTKGTADGSINDMACGENVISVGAYTTRTHWPLLNGTVYLYSGTGYSVGDIAPFSSYGPNFAGTQLPLITAPGANIISSYSRFYVGSNGNTTMTASAANGSDTDYWGPMQGTSMSCPYVTGTVGLWLQADPTLKFADVMDVINKTSTTDTYTAASPLRFGAGKINALDGIKYILSTSSIGNVWADDDQRLIIQPVGNGYEVYVAGEDNLTVTVYDLQGRPVARATGMDQATVSTASLQRGVYVIEAAGSTGRFTRKVTL